MTQFTVKYLNMFCAGACFSAGGLSLLLAIATDTGYFAAMFCLAGVVVNLVCWRWL
jgi:hypothetical protein